MSSDSRTEENKEIVRRWYTDVWNEHDLGLIEKLIAPQFKSHDPSSRRFQPGPAGARSLVQMYREAFPNLRIDIEDIFAEEDKVVVRWTVSGSYKHNVRSGSAKKASASGISIFALSDGKIVERWTNWDSEGFRRQLSMHDSMAAAG